ncbi:hybrid sensor histidine kinase/response regulator, partial [Pseudoxanthomonas sp. SGD-10]
KTAENIVITSAINALLVDSDKNLWIATMSQGIFKYNPRSSKLKKVNVDNADLGMNASWAIVEDKSGTVWAGTRLGLLRYNAQKDKFETIESLFSKDENSNHEILSILEDRKGNLWLGTWSNGLRYYNKQTEEYSSYLHQSKSNYVTHIRSIFQYKENELLIGSDDGLYLFNLDSRASKRIDIPQSKYSLSDQNVYSIAEDKEGGIWIGTYFGGVNYLNTALLSIETYYPDVLRGFLSGKAVSQFCEDPSGNMWIATEDGGLNYFDVKSKIITQPVKTSYHNTHALLLDGENLWIGTFSRGIDVYNTKTKATINYRYKSDDVNTINDDCIFSLYKTKSGEIYAGTPVGLNKFNRETRKFVRVKDVVGFVYDIKEDDYGDL